METTKTILAMIGLVLIGFVAGFFLHRHLTQQHFTRVKNMATPMGLQEQLFQIIDADEQQRKTLEPIVTEHLMELKSMMATFKKQRGEMVDDLKEAIEPELSPKQQKKFERFSKRLKKFQKNRRKKYREGKKQKKEMSKE